ncbi:NaeI family type II restriction endonuclease [Streptomyces sp. NRRL S-244]|uniref:NaeI family type II restriction endonuclease n=1 Tax=Streptomyces sp. NRRL S-244 TaxID=1463897 RepID=UPI00131A4DD2|nr:NaeI family type II restriction endonuclease [Streptomyces sp. NRRL S-244]
MTSTPGVLVGASIPSVSDSALAEVVAEIKSLDGKGRNSLKSRFARVFRDSIDEILDGRRTRRYRFSKVSPPEKSYLGTKVEILVRDEFGFSEGVDLDYLIAGHEVDAKFSSTGAWMIAPKNIGEICLVMRASEETAKFSVGVVRATPDLLRPAKNRDSKRVIHAEGQKEIVWLVKEAQYAENQLMELDRRDSKAVASVFALGSGQARINELFRLFPLTVMNGTTVQTVASQLDSSKRVREARDDLRDKGVVILGADEHYQLVAAALGLRPIAKGTWIGVPLAAKTPGRLAFEVDGIHYCVAGPGEARVKAPVILKGWRPSSVS